MSINKIENSLNTKNLIYYIYITMQYFYYIKCIY